MYSRAVKQILFVLLSFAFACDTGGPDRSKDAPPTVTSGAASPESTPAKDVPGAQRIVCLAPNLTEIAFALGLGPRVVGVSDFANYPPEVESLERLGGLLDPNLEKVLLLQPDLLLLHASSERVADKARRLGIRAMTFKADSLEEVLGVILKMGQATDTLAAARTLVASMKSELEGLRSPHGGERPRVLIVVGRDPGSLRGITSVGPGTFLHELVELAGGANIAANAGSLWPTMSKEAILAAAPDIILELTPGETASNTDHDLADWRALPSLPAVRENRIARLDGPHLLIPGPRLVDTARDLRLALDKMRSRGPDSGYPNSSDKR